MDAYLASLSQKPKVEQSTQGSLWLFTFNLFLIGINLLFFAGLFPKIIKTYDSFGGFMPSPLEYMKSVSIFFDHYWFLSFPLLFMMIVVGAYYLFYRLKKDRHRFWILASMATVLVAVPLAGLIFPYLSQRN